MADVLDILELDRDVGNERKSTKKKRHTDPGFKKPEGMNREVYALLYADNKDNAPLIPSDFGIASKLGFPEYGYKTAKANLSLRKVRKWSWMPFTNPARKDGFQLCHWRREADKAKEYPFAKMNVTANIPTYTDNEYHQWLLSESWTKTETDYLMRMCKKFDLRFIVIEDKWDRATYNNRSVEDIKDRYYSICNTLSKHRNENARSDPNFAGAMKQPICIFDAEHERKRKEQLTKLYNRTSKEVEEEQHLIAELRKIEQRKKEREKKTQDLQKLITAADSTTELRRNEQQQQSRPSLSSSSRSNRKKTSSQVKSSRSNDNNATSVGTPNLESASIKFPDPKSNGIYLRSSRMKLPSSVGQKRMKAIAQLLNELKIEQHPMASDDICQHFNDLRSDMVLLYELKIALSTLEFDLQSLKHQVESSSDSPMPPPLSAPSTPMSAPATVPKTLTLPATPVSALHIKEEANPKKISEIIDVNATPRKRKAAMESENFLRKINRKS